MDHARIDALRLQLDNNTWVLRFPPPLEAEFKADYARRYLRQMRTALLFGLLALATVGLLDFYWMPTLARRLWRIRLCCFLPMLAIQALCFTALGQRHIQALIVASAACAAGMLVLCSIVASAPFADYYRSGLSLVVLIVFVLSRLQFFPGLVAAVIILAELNAGFACQDLNDLHLTTPANFLILASAGCALMGTFMIERSVRQLYLHGRLLALRLQDLEASNVQLKHQTAIDGLTQIANRRALDNALAFEWQRSLQKQLPLALIMLDVDHFKLYNDHYGHQAGDDCLRRVAAVIAAAARRPFDLAARYGGEEFCIVLAGTSASEAASVAEHARHAVMQLGLPHQGSGHGRVTVSLGVTCAIPTTEGGPELLVRAADQALYKAKHAGRNCVVVSAGVSPAAPALKA